MSDKKKEEQELGGELAAWLERVANAKHELAQARLIRDRLTALVGPDSSVSRGPTARRRSAKPTSASPHDVPELNLGLPTPAVDPAPVPDPATPPTTGHTSMPASNAAAAPLPDPTPAWEDADRLQEFVQNQVVADRGGKLTIRQLACGFFHWLGRSELTDGRMPHAVATKLARMVKARLAPGVGLANDLVDPDTGRVVRGLRGCRLRVPATDGPAAP